MGQPCVRQASPCCFRSLAQLPSCSEPVSRQSGALESGLDGFRINSAVVLLKPSAVTPAAIALVETCLEQASLRVVQAGRVEAEAIRERGLVDAHYRAVASKAFTRIARDLAPTHSGFEEFKRVFRTPWRTAVKQHLVVNASQAAARLEISTMELSHKFHALRAGRDVVRLGGGFYCGRIDGLYVVNGYYPLLREKFLQQGAAVHYWALEWPSEEHMSFSQFLEDVRGSPNPVQAKPCSIRYRLYKNWKELGLQEQPSIADNGFHTSASPYEAMLERHIWLGKRLEDDSFMKALNASTVVSEALIQKWWDDPVVTFDWERCQFLDLLKGTDTAECLRKTSTIHVENEGAWDSISSPVSV